MASIFGRQVVLPLVNKSGGSVAAGDVVIVDTTNNDAFTTTTSAADIKAIGIAQETIGSNATGRVLVGGYAALVNVNASVTRGNFGKTHTVAKQATDAGSVRVAGTFCRFLTGGTTPTALVYPVDLAGAALTNPMTTTGDMIYSSDNSGTPARRGIGSTGDVLTVSGGVPTWAAPASGGITQAYEGYNTVGGSTESIDEFDIYTKTFTPAQNELLQGVAVHLKWQEDYSWIIWVALYDDNSGSPGKVLAANSVGSRVALHGLDLHQATEVARWIELPLSALLTASTVYYVGVSVARTDGSGSAPLIYYDGSGSDKTLARTNAIILEGTPQTWANSTKKYSIRANTIR